MLSNFQLPPSSNESHGHLCTTETWKRTDCTNTLENTHRATISSSFIQFNGFFVQAKLSCSEITFVHRPCPDFIFFFSFRDKVSSANVAHTAGEHSFTVLKRKYRIQYGFKFSTKTERKEEKAKIVTNDRVYVSEDPVEQTTGRRLLPSCCAHFTHRPLVIQAFAFSPEFTTKPETSMLGEPWEVCHMTNTGVLNLILLLSNNRLVNKRGNIWIRATACTQRSKSKVLK